jgi:hypothetical protein
LTLAGDTRSVRRLGGQGRELLLAGGNAAEAEHRLSAAEAVPTDLLSHADVMR